MSGMPPVPMWYYDAVTRNPDAPPAHWSIRIAGWIVSIVLALAGAVVLLVINGMVDRL